MDSTEPAADQLRRLGWMAGIAGPVPLIVYFTTPALATRRRSPRRFLD
jgi:hypothetical protein